jgi:hypothetical protein
VLAAAAIVAACGSPPQPATSASPQAPVTPAEIFEIRSALPAGYETGELRGPVSAAALWGFGPGWTADPPQCRLLADPGPEDPSARGLSASGPGGTVFVVAAARVGGPPEADLVSQCDRWTMHYGHTDADVARTAAPEFDGSTVLAWRAVARTVVESGNATVTEASTTVAYLAGHVVILTLVTDPGSAHPPLDSAVAEGLLAAAVRKLRVH